MKEERRKVDSSCHILRQMFSWWGDVVVGRRYGAVGDPFSLTRDKEMSLR
jgi:hypothetical protein